MSNLFNLELEKYFLARAIKDSSIIDELANVISERDFSDTHKIIYQAIKAVKNEKGACDAVLLIDKLNACGAKIGSKDYSVEPATYINNGLAVLDIPHNTAIIVAKELASKTVQRELFKMAQEIAQETNTKETPNAIDLINKINRIYNAKVNILSAGKADEPKDLFAGAEEYIESLGNNPQICGVKSPYPIFADFFGDFSPGDMSFVIARPKAGKSTFLLNTLIQSAQFYSKNSDRKFRALYLDTELEYEREVRRMVASLSGVNEYFLKTGLYRKNEEMVEKVRAVWKTIKPLMNTIDHIYIGGKKHPEVMSLIRRWHGKNIGINQDEIDVIVALDYVKLGSADDLTGPVKDYQLVGQKVDGHKQLATELKYHCLTAGQANRGNEGRDDDKIVSDGSVVGLSDQISQFASNIYLLQKLTLGQFALFGDIATHSLSPLYTRNQGANSQGFNSLVKYEDKNGKVKYTENFILYNFDNFNVKEVIDFRSFLDKKKIQKIDLDTANGNTLPI